MITYLELLHGHNVDDLTVPQQHNLEDLLKAINVIRDAWGKPMTVTSGFRSVQDQARINPKVTNSAHMVGMAVDIADDGSLYKWCEANVPLLEKTVLWIEAGTQGWVHFQIRPAHNRFFIP